MFELVLKVANLIVNSMSLFFKVAELAKKIKEKVTSKKQPPLC